MTTVHLFKLFDRNENRRIDHDDGVDFAPCRKGPMDPFAFDAFVKQAAPAKRVAELDAEAKTLIEHGDNQEPWYEKVGDFFFALLKSVTYLPLVSVVCAPLLVFPKLYGYVVGGVWEQAWHDVRHDQPNPLEDARRNLSAELRNECAKSP